MPTALATERGRPMSEREGSQSFSCCYLADRVLDAKRVGKVAVVVAGVM